MDYVRNQVAEYESSGGTKANTLPGTDMPIIVITTVGNKTGKIRKTPLMRVEHDGEYALVASQGRGSDPPCLVLQPGRRSGFRRIAGRAAPFDVTVTRGHRRREGDMVEARGGGLPALRRVPGEDRPADPAVRRHSGASVKHRGAVGRLGTRPDLSRRSPSSRPSRSGAARSWR